MNQLFRRVMLMIGRGRITTVNDAGAVQKTQVQMGELELRDNLARLAEFGFTSNLPVGTDVVVAYIGGDRSNGVIIASGHQPSRPVGLLPGESMLYSQDGKYVYMTASGGIVVEAKGQAVTVNDATTVTVHASASIELVTPTVHMTGNLNVDGTITAPLVVGTTDVTFGGKSGIGHTHSGVQTGSGSTGAPN